jgi:hypothetical protein
MQVAPKADAASAASSVEAANPAEQKVAEKKVELKDGQYLMYDGRIMSIPDLDVLIFACEGDISREDIRENTDAELACLVDGFIWARCEPGSRCNWSKCIQGCRHNSTVVMKGSGLAKGLVSACSFCARHPDAYSFDKGEYAVIMEELTAGEEVIEELAASEGEEEDD